MGIAQAEHEESAPTATTLVISRLACSLVGSAQTIALAPGSLAHRLYAQTSVTEEFSCNYGLNPDYHDLFDQGDLRSVGTDADGAVRMVELRTHPFFLATLFLPQIRSTAARPHPLITAYLHAAASNLRPHAEG